MYDRKSNIIHGEANLALQKSVEGIVDSNQKHKWTSKQMQVPPQTDGESCGYRMLHNMNMVCKQQEIQGFEKKKQRWKDVW